MEVLYHYGSEAQQRQWLPRMVSGEVVAAIGDKVTIDDAKIEEYYQSNQRSFTVPEQRRARHILFKVEDKAGVAADKAKGIYEDIVRRQRESQILGLVREIAPAAMASLVAPGGRVSFGYDAPSGSVAVCCSIAPIENMARSGLAFCTSR